MPLISYHIVYTRRVSRVRVTIICTTYRFEYAHLDTLVHTNCDHLTASTHCASGRTHYQVLVELSVGAQCEFRFIANPHTHILHLHRREKHTLRLKCDIN